MQTCSRGDSDTNSAQTKGRRYAAVVHQVAPQPTTGFAFWGSMEQMTNTAKRGSSTVQDTDPSLLLQMVGGDEALLRRIGGLFLDDYADAIERARAALGRADRDTLYSIVHSLKGSASSFGARHLVGMAQEIEKACRAGTLEPIPPLLDAFAAETESLAAALRSQLGSASG